MERGIHADTSAPCFRPASPVEESRIYESSVWAVADSIALRRKKKKWSKGKVKDKANNATVLDKPTLCVLQRLTPRNSG